ncbi:sodium:solute symporter family protein [Brevibacterium yomogidense]|uniref:Sodium-solute symporter, putative n=1 Tax=Brevibacterium yomogidense TaxID=946573 RepID=A0A1X6XJ11_9MICO|nr:sodium:solute symporter family protein [Brevibacterium yomogidense]SLM99078.1 sodium-solute symporter, putative [Brevibacterium yomogidense]
MNPGTIALISATAFIVLGIGAWISFYVGKKNNTEEDWLVGGRSLPMYVVAFTQYATAVGGGVLVAHVGIGYAWGLSVFWYELFVVAGMLIIAVFANWLRKGRFSTIPDIFVRLYGRNKTLLSVVAIAVILVPFGWLATQFVAFASLFSEVTGIPFTPLIVAMAIISLLFVLPGGLTSVAWSDFFFGVFMVGISIVIAIYAVMSAGGWGEVVERVPDDFFTMPQGLTLAGAGTIVLWFFAIVPGTLTNQLYYQRVFASRSGKDARTSLYLGAVMVMIAGVYAFFIGVSIRAMNPTMGEDGRELAAGWFLTQVPTWLLALYGAFLMATIVSTTGSALQSVVANLINDLRGAFIKEKTSGKQTITLSRWCTVGVTAVAAVLAIVYPKALEWLVATYAYSASILAVPMLVGIIMAKRFRIPVQVAFAAMGVGLVGCGVAHLMGTTIPYAVFGIVASAVAYVIAMAIWKPVRVPGGLEPDGTAEESTERVGAPEGEQA